MTIHQPSSQMFYMFDKLLLLSNGNLAYFGNVDGVVPFFSTIGYIISLHYNPADFILEKVKNPVCEEKIVFAAKSLEKTPIKYSSEDNCFCPSQKSKKDVEWQKSSFKSIHLNESDQLYENQISVHNDNDSGRSSWSEPDRSSTLSNNSLFKDDYFNKNISIESNQKWATSMLTQVVVLTERNFIESKHKMLSKLNWIQTIVLGFISGLIWFQIPRNENTIDDIRGWMFFSKSLHWHDCLQLIEFFWQLPPTGCCLACSKH